MVPKSDNITLRSNPEVDPPLTHYQPSTSFGFALTDEAKHWVLEIRPLVSEFRLVLDRSPLHRQVVRHMSGYENFFTNPAWRHVEE